MQDFASYRNTTYLDDSKLDASDWSPDIPSVMLGVMAGAFVAIREFKVAKYRADQVVFVEAPAV